jgi:hypothetical protein
MLRCRHAHAAVRVDIGGTNMTAYRNWPSDVTKISKFAFQGGLFDGVSVWLAPSSAGAVIPATQRWLRPNNISSLTHGGFYGSAFDGHSMRMVPYRTDAVVSMNLSSAADDALGPVLGRHIGRPEEHSSWFGPGIGPFVPYAESLAQSQVLVDAPEGGSLSLTRGGSPGSNGTSVWQSTQTVQKVVTRGHVYV